MADPEANERSSVAPTRTELVWPGKRTQVDRVALPFQVVETINQSRATREQTPMLAGLPPPPLFEGQTNPDTSWKNKLIWGDNKYVMASLLQGDSSIGLEPLAGKIDLIYIDPPFATGQAFSYHVRVGDEEWVKEASIIEETAYRDTWGRGLESYLQMMYERLRLMREILAETGSIFVHVDWSISSYVRTMLSEVFGDHNCRNEIAWWYYNKLQGNVGRFPANHDTIFWFSKGPTFTFNKLSEKRDEIQRQQRRVWDSETGRLKQARDEEGNLVYYDRDSRTIDDVWRLPYLVPADQTENVRFQTQKPARLLRRIILAASNPGDLVADFFCGASTALVCAEDPLYNYIEKHEKLILDDPQLGSRRWIGCDLSRYAIQVSRKRMLDIEGCQPFQVLNLGKYERKHWQVNVLNGQQEDGHKAIAEYYRFIVALYRAEAAGGYAHLHGQKAGRWVHVGASDAPVTRAEIMDAVRECQANRYTALDVLGWEWEMGLHDTAREEAQRMGVDLRLFYIPREVMDRRAVQAGDVRFYELAYLKSSLLQDNRTATVRLEDFIIPNPDLVPDEVRSKVKKWSDYIDFWAVDWNYREDTFHNEWQTYRTRKSPALRLISDPHSYAEAGSYRILVKVIDIFGNDTTQLLERFTKGGQCQKDQ